jgi:hypothetical protein
MNYKSHYDLSWLQWGEQKAREVHEVKGKIISYPQPEGRVPFIDREAVR